MFVCVLYLCVDVDVIGMGIVFFFLMLKFILRYVYVGEMYVG